MRVVVVAIATVLVPVIAAAAFSDLERIGIDATTRTELVTDTDRAAVVVAVIDTGLDYDHPGIGVDNLWLNEREQPNGIDDDHNGYVDDFIGWDFVDGDNDPWDWVGHGTHVAGIIVAKPDEDLGVAGVDSRAQIMVLRALNSVGRGWSTRIAAAIRYAVDNGAKVINLSMAVKDISAQEQAAVRYARAHDVVVVVAAGNAGDDAATYTPAAIDGALTVAAIGPDDAHATYSNWGAVIDIAAPGNDILSLRAANTDFMFAVGAAGPLERAAGPTTQYYHATGTSFAAPFVSGAAALLRSREPQLTATEVERMLLQSADDVGVPGFDQFTGYGRLNARAALAADPAFYIEAKIAGVQVVNVNGTAKLRVNGTAKADALSQAWIELGPGEDPAIFKRVSRPITSNIDAGVLDELAAGQFAGSKRWTLRLIVEHRNGKRREARFLVNLG